MSWDDAKAYCKWRSNKEGKRYRPPTEAEWEYSCRGGTTTIWSFGDDSSELNKFAWYTDNANGKVHPVGDKKPNPWGLYDMHGNVWEWCEDQWSDNYDITPRDGSGDNYRVLRVGSWYYDSVNCCSSFRSRDFPSVRNVNIGFRLVVC